MKNKYYVGAPHLINDTRGYLKATIEEAIEAAKLEVEEKEIAQIVVKVVAIVEPVKKPVRVRRIK